MKTILAILIGFLFAVCGGCAQDRSLANRQDLPQVYLNAEFIEQVQLDEIDLGDWADVLRTVLAGAGDGIVVYPSEGYYYFSFYDGGDVVRGNLRFDVLLRDEGIVAFAYFRQFAGRARRIVDRDNFWELGAEDGITLIKIDQFRYHLSFQEFSLPVEIYNAERELEASKPLSNGEVYVGPVFDESGVRFHLIFDLHTNVFLFVLNDTLGVSETFRQLDGNPRILIGNRTQFVFFDDPDRNRQVLIGVNYENVLHNTYYDGPFDQLPDSFIDPEYLMTLILLYNPSLEGVIGPGGHYLSEGDLRAGLYPYMEYYYESQLRSAAQCEALLGEVHELNRCLAQLSVYVEQD